MASTHEQRPRKPPRMIFGMPAPVAAWSVVFGVVIGTVFTLLVVKPHPSASVSAPPPGGTTAVMLLEPLGPIANPPQLFRWTSQSGAANYRVELFDVHGTRLGSIVTADTLLPVASFAHAAPKAGVWTVAPLGADGVARAPGVRGVFEVAY